MEWLVELHVPRQRNRRGRVAAIDDKKTRFTNGKINSDCTELLACSGLPRGLTHCPLLEGCQPRYLSELGKPDSHLGDQMGEAGELYKPRKANYKVCKGCKGV